MRTYEKYKESGVEWIGEIPEHWEFVSLRRITLDHKQGYYLPEGYIESGCKLIRISDLSVNGRINYDTAPSTNITNQDYEIFNLQIGDFLFPRTGSIGLLGYVEEDIYAVFASYLIRFRFAPSVEPQFLKYYFVSVSFIEGIFSELHGGVNQNIHAENIKNQFIPIPSLSEQTTIANYLDSKTTEIDQVVADKETLVSLYEEEKKALINEAVTKGLNTNVRLISSNIDWLGDVPEHWEVKKLFYLFDKISSGTTPKSDEESYYLDGHINWLNTGDLNNSRITETSKKITQKAFDDHSALKVYPIGSIVIAMYGATIGKLGILDIETTTNQACCVLSDIKNTNTLYVFNCLISGQEALINLSYGGGQPNISQDTLRNFRIPIPPLEEQTAIVQYIENKTANINEKINQIKQEIALLKEYRQALIFEAVTGKIRVFD